VRRSDDATPRRPVLNLDPTPPGAFCWLDLAASDAARAKRFYAQLFGWGFVEQDANGGSFTRCRVGGQDVGSLYQLKRAQLERGVPSHWTPYICVERIDVAARRVVTLGGRLVVAPFDVQGQARIALIEDAVGALVGLWEPVRQPVRDFPADTR
jgi:predicted enzyme related to lactoylglutathione lyase